MRTVQEVVEELSEETDTEKNKVKIIKWFRRHPGRRFDKLEVYGALGDELGVGPGRVGQYLKELEEDEIVVARGDQRKAYRLSNDIMIPAKYQALAGLRHLTSILDLERWGKSGFVVFTTTAWAFLTLPFWFLSLVVLITPIDNIGVLSQGEIVVSTIGMTIWLIIFLVFTFIVYYLRQWQIQR